MQRSTGGLDFASRWADLCLFACFKLTKSQNARKLDCPVDQCRSAAFNLVGALLADSLQPFGRDVFMITRFAFTLCLATLGCAVFAQGPRPSNLGASNLDLGESGIQWYTTWESAEAEAKRSGRAIMFVAAATQCHGVSGVF